MRENVDQTNCSHGNYANKEIVLCTQDKKCQFSGRQGFLSRLFKIRIILLGCLFALYLLSWLEKNSI